ncbi:MAG TPA: tetratricopeptide repeat protein [Polyangium sp.]|nr:tetratricopeptide repeat protein [Polyangium sp.]
MDELTGTKLPERLADRDEEEWDRFRVMLEYAAGFWLAFVFAPSSLDARVIRERVTEALALEGARVDVMLPQSPDEMGSVLPWLLSRERAGAGCVWVQAVQVDGGAWAAEWTQFFLRANEKREVFRRQFSGGLVLVAPVAMKVVVRDAAPDLWSIRAIVLELSGTTGATGTLSVGTERLATREERTSTTAPDAAYWMAEAASRQPGSEGRAFALFQASLGWVEKGRFVEALAAMQEAVGIYRQLAEGRPGAYLPNLASSLNNLGIRQSDLGQREAALASTQEAVAIRRKLSAQRPETLLPELALSLNNLGKAQSALGYREAALASTQEALGIYSKLSQQRPDAFLPDLAQSLNNLGKMQSDLGQREAALASTQEAVDIRRKLSEQRPETFLPDLARSLNNLGKMQSDVGQREAALASTQEALGICRPLSEQRSDTFLPDLAMCLHNLSIDYRQFERHEEARALAQEAFDAYWLLYEQYPRVFAQNVRDAFRLLTNLGTPLDPTTLDRMKRFSEHEAENRT